MINKYFLNRNNKFYYYHIIRMILIIIGIIVYILYRICTCTEQFSVFKVLDKNECKDNAICNCVNNKEFCYNHNVNCKNNYEYQKKMCIWRKIYDNDRLCNSIIDIVPRPQNVNSPKKFLDF